MLWDIKKLSEHLNIKVSTLYHWVAQGKIAYYRLNGLIRFHPDQIQTWLESLNADKRPSKSYINHKESYSGDIDSLIESAKRKAYNESYGKPDRNRA